jgi:hypothetical protein
MRTGLRFYPLVALGVAAAVCIAVAGINLVVDPYGAYGWSPTAAVKPAVYRRVKLAKAEDLRRIRAQAIVLGTSRSHVGLRMTYPGWTVPVERRYNAAFDGATTKEMYAYLLHAYAIAPLKQVVLGLDFWQLARNPASTRSDFDQNLLFEPQRPLHNAKVYATDLALLISFDSTTASITELLKADTEPQWFARDGQRLGDVFFREIEPSYRESPGRYFREVDRQEVSFMQPSGETRSPSKLQPSQVGPQLTSFDYIARIVEFCSEHRIDLRIFITPSHVHQLEIAARFGQWPVIEQGKRDLVALLQQISTRSKKSPFILYDFASYSSVTVERVPEDRENREMEFYWDSSHFKQRVGDWVLDRLFGTNSSANPVPRDFGVRLSTENIESALADVRARREAYLCSHPEDLAFLTKLTKSAEAASQDRLRPD